jgi:hypothetical protein
VGNQIQNRIKNYENCVYRVNYNGDMLAKSLKVGRGALRTAGGAGISQVWFEDRYETLIQINENPTRGEA